MCCSPAFSIPLRADLQQRAKCEKKGQTRPFQGWGDGYLWGVQGADLGWGLTVREVSRGWRWRGDGNEGRSVSRNWGWYFIVFFFHFFKDFLTWTIFKVLIKFVIILLLFYILGFLVGRAWGMWDLSSPTNSQTHIPCIGRWNLITGPPAKPQGQIVLRQLKKHFKE